MWEAVHASFNAYENETILICLVAELIVEDDVFRKSVNLHPQKLWSRHWCVEIETFQVRPRNFAPGVEMTLFRRSFTVRRMAVGVPQSMSMLILSPPIVSRVLLVSAFWGRALHTILAYVMSFHRSGGTSCLWMKNSVLVPSFLPGMHCTMRPISFPKECPHAYLYFGILMRWRYSSSSPDLSSTALA